MPDRILSGVGCPWGIYAQSKNGVTPSGFVRPVFLSFPGSKSGKPVHLNANWLFRHAADSDGKKGVNHWSEQAWMFC